MARCSDRSGLPPRRGSIVSGWAAQSKLASDVMKIDEDIAAHYEEGREQDRLTSTGSSRTSRAGPVSRP